MRCGAETVRIPRYYGCSETFCRSGNGRPMIWLRILSVKARLRRPRKGRWLRRRKCYRQFDQMHVEGEINNAVDDQTDCRVWWSGVVADRWSRDRFRGTRCEPDYQFDLHLPAGFGCAECARI